MSERAHHKATLDDFFAIPENERFHELIGGEIIEKASPSGEHGGAQAGVIGAIRSPYQRRQGGPGGPGGWWIQTEVEVALASGEIVRPDVVGWKRERSPEQPSGFPIKLRPDWICEVISPQRATDDTVKKLRLYHQAKIPHYWLVDTRAAQLTVMRWSDAGYITVLTAERGEVVRPEPFDGIQLAVGTLFGDDPPE